jgi:hypothetical protein
MEESLMNANPQEVYRMTSWPVRDLPYVKACMDRWARYYTGAGYGSMSITGKLMQGMRSTTCPCRGNDERCPLCEGTGKISGDLEALRQCRTIYCPDCDKDEDGFPLGEVNGTTCFKCRGSGLRVYVSQKVNPAGIKSTRYVGGKGEGDRVTMLIEDQVRAWKLQHQTRWLARVVVKEYFFNGTHETKAISLGKSREFFSRTLNEAHARIELLLDCE